MKSGIYGFKNTENGKWYIGQSINLIRRKNEHIGRLRSKSHYNQRLQNDFNLHGEYCFEYHVLEECIIDMLSIREEVWIKYFNSFDKEKGYNQNSPSKPCTEEAREKISKALKGRKFTLEWLKKLSDAKIGKKHSEETKKKRAEKLKGNKFRLGKEPANKGKTGFKHSEETKKKMVLAWIRKKALKENLKQIRN